MTAIRVMLLTMATAWAASIGGVAPAAAQDIYSLQARLMQLEAKVREITTFKPAPPPTQGGEALSQRIRTLELTVAEMQNTIKNLQTRVDKLAAAGK